ncbi:MAG: hypothetical protein GY820_17320 [Gammaproteobacteria bacterium]|nr:hypothetical protein [Gammaproteobacteria bacterium]
MKKLNPKIIRFDDMVIIRDPRFFIRCGYPMDIKGTAYGIDSVHRGDIEHLVYQTTGFTPTLSSARNIDRAQRSYYKILEELAYIKMHREGFGGIKRTIYRTDAIDLCKGQRAIVEDIKYCKTGEYEREYNDHEYEYEPAGLSDQETHKLLRIFFPGMTIGNEWIEADFVEKVMPGKENENDY